MAIQLYPASPTGVGGGHTALQMDPHVSGG